MEGLPTGTFEHAKIVMTRWGQVLAFIELRDDNDCECLRLQLWAPVGEDETQGQITFRIGLNEDASDGAHDAMSVANRSALAAFTTERAESVIAEYGVAELLDNVFSKAASSPR